MRRASPSPAAVSLCPALSRLGPALLVTAQVLVDFHTGRISDLQHLYVVHHLAAHPAPYLGVRIEYPVLTGAFMTAAAALSAGLRSYLVLSSLGLWACAIGSVYVLSSLSHRAAWCFALCPLLIVYSLLNWDLLAIVLMLLGWRAFRRDRQLAAGAWLALGTFAKLYPAVLLVFCLVELTRRRRGEAATARALARFLGAAAAVTIAVNAPFAILAFGNWRYFWSFNATRNGHADLFSWLHLLGGTGVGAANLVLAGTVLAASIVGTLAIWRRGAGVGPVAAGVFFVFMLAQKVYSPQYTLWLVVFALLADARPWMIAALSVMGLVDYADAVIHIALVQHHSAFVAWYDRHVSPLDQGLRLLTTLVIATTIAAPRLRAPLAHRRARGHPLTQTS